MIVVAIIGILAAIAIPKFASLLRKSNEGKMKGNLGSMRSALTIYYGDMEGVYPSDLNSLTISGKYMGAIPAVAVPNYHGSTQVIRHNLVTNPFGCGGGYMLDTGEWIYWSDAGALCGSSPAPAGQRQRVQGELWIACSHTDTKATQWSQY
jgi:type II secretory pathway pseudopilin PulG